MVVVPDSDPLMKREVFSVTLRKERKERMIKSKRAFIQSSLTLEYLEHNLDRKGLTDTFAKVNELWSLHEARPSIKIGFL